jgi:hypothetical protein
MTQKDEKSGAQDESRRKAEARAKALRANLRRRKEAAKPAAPQLGTGKHG